MSMLVLVCGNVFDGLSDALTGPAEILVEGNRIAGIERSVRRPPGARVIDLSERTVSPGFIDTHVHLTMDAADLALQTLQSSAAKALKGLSLAREYMNYGFTTLRDLGSVDPEWPTIDLRDALNSGLVEGPRLFVAAHIISASAGHGDLRGFYASRWTLPVSAIADDLGSIRALVRREHAFGSDWIKTANTGGYFSAGDDPARVTWFDDEMETLTSTAHQLGMPVAVHTGAAAGCKQAIRSGARSVEHAYLIDAEGIEMAERAGAYIVPTMQMTQEDLHELQAGTLPCQAVWKFRRDNEGILASQRLLAGSRVKVAYGTDCGMFPFSHGILEFQAMVKAGLSPARALQAGTSVAAELLGRSDLGALRPRQTRRHRRHARRSHLGYAIAIVAFIRVGEKLLRRFGARKPMIQGCLITGISIILLLPSNLMLGEYKLFAIVGYTLYGVGLAFYATPSTDAALSSLPAAQVGSGAGIYKMASSLDAAFGVAISAAIFTALSANPAAVNWLEGVITFQGRQDNLAIRQAAMIALAFNVFMVLVAIMSIMLTVPKGEKTA